MEFITADKVSFYYETDEQQNQIVNAIDEYP